MTVRFHGHRAVSTVAVLAVLTTAALTLSGCGRSAGGAAGGKIRVVASTNVWGSVVRAVGGDAIELRSIILTRPPTHTPTKAPRRTRRL